MERTNDASGRLGRLSHVSDPAEFIKLFRSMVADENQLPEHVIFPLDDDAASDLLYTLLGVWLAMCAPPPLESKADLIAAVDRMVTLLKQVQGHFPEDQERFKRDVMHCMRRGVTPDYWPRVK